MIKKKKATKKKATKKKKKTISLPKLSEKAQRVFNAYIRKRDSDGEYFTCISCSRTLPISKMNAGHYAAVKTSSYLRFHEWNVNGECQGCNGFDEFHLIGYRKNLIDKIGQEAVDWIEEVRRTTKKWTRAELLEIIEKYS
jgi:Bacteriophage Lambda NinG protein